MATNIITAKIKGRSAIAEQHGFQYDYGMVLKISGVELPAAYQVDFSNEPIMGTAYQQIGNADGVAIPDACFESGDDIFAWVYLHSGEDDGETVYQIMIPVYKRSKTSGETPTPAQQSAIDEAIAALNEAVESADASAETATEAAASAAESAAQAATSAEGAEHYAQEAAASAEEAAGYVATVSEYASQAAASATAAASSAASADHSADEADTSADAAAISATNAAASATAASGSATTATQKATEAANSATAASGSASAASSSATEAAGSATSASQSATAAAGSATEAASSATSANNSATTASTKAADAAASATSAASSAAEAAETAAGITADLMNKADVITDTASGSIVSITDGMASPVLGLSVDIEPIQEGTGDPSPTNVRPISGRSEVSVTRTGKNLSSVSSHTGGQTTFWGTDWDELKSVLNALPAGTYSLSLKGKIDSLPDGNSVAHGRPYITAMVNGTQTTVLSYSIQTDSSPSVGKVYSESGVFTISEDAVGKINHAYLYLDSSVSHTTGRGAYEIYDLQVEIGSTATSYEPYQGQTVTIQLGQTVYGGTVDVANGVLSVSKQKYLFSGSETWNFTNGFFYASASYAIGHVKTGNYLTENGVSVTLNIVNSQIRVYLARNSFLSEESDMHDYLTNGMGVVYELATPVEVTLTAEELDILFGDNVVFADSGNVSVDYRCDTKKYILKKIAEALNA